MTYLITAVVSGAAGLVIGALAMMVRLAALRQRSRELEERAAKAEELAGKLESAERRAAQSESALAFHTEQAQRERDLLEQHRLRELEAKEQVYTEKLSASEQVREQEKKALAEANAELKKQYQEARAEQEKNWEAKLALLKEEFKTLSVHILEERAGALKEMNREQMSTIVNPLKEKLQEFKTAVDAANLKGVELNTALQTRLVQMMETTEKIGSEANHLAAALKGGNKVQGNWGEMILETLLKDSGLQPGIHYEAQATIRDEAGQVVRTGDSRMMRPDVIVHYPDGKDVIVDSKVSLTAYTDYVNAENEAEKVSALKRHMESIHAHVDELAKKNYAAYLNDPKRETVNFVLLFIPNESPYQLAMLTEPSLWRAAFEKKVLLVSPVNLMALLQMIQIAWTRADQERNQQLILDTSAQLMERLYGLYEDFDTVGRKLDEARETYQNTVRRLRGTDGARSVVKSGEKLLQLGVKMKKNKPLPKRFTEPELFNSSTVEILPSAQEINKETEGK